MLRLQVKHMEYATSADETLDRMIYALKLKNDSELSKKLGVTSQAVSKARTTGKIPASWVPKLAYEHKISTDWLFFGCSFPSLDNETPVKMESNSPQSGENCARCAKLEAKLDILEEERRELAAENRKLWKENGELKERCARLEPRQKQEEARPFDERRKIPASSEAMQSRV